MSDETDGKVEINISKATYDDWLTDLRSGQFKQTRQHLCEVDIYHRTEKVYCCLGVLGERLNLLVEDENGFHAEGMDDEYLPYDIIDEETQQELAQMNDDHGFTFPKIADYIEKNLAPKL